MSRPISLKKPRLIPNSMKLEFQNPRWATATLSVSALAPDAHNAAFSTIENARARCITLNPLSFQHACRVEPLMTAVGLGRAFSTLPYSPPTQLGWNGHDCFQLVPDLVSDVLRSVQTEPAQLPRNRSQEAIHDDTDLLSSILPAGTCRSLSASFS